MSLFKLSQCTLTVLEYPHKQLIYLTLKPARQFFLYSMHPVFWCKFYTYLVFYINFIRCET